MKKEVGNEGAMMSVMKKEKMTGRWPPSTTKHEALQLYT
jgi:hypothetical protein